MPGGAEETESKHRVLDLDLLLRRLDSLGYRGGETQLQVDEYYDDPCERLARGDYVLRLRSSGDATVAAFKGPCTRNEDGTCTRIEVEVPVASAAEVRGAWASRHLLPVRWVEKRRREFQGQPELIVALDELPQLGTFVEFEGRPEDIAELIGALGAVIGPAETNNYFELFLDWSMSRGHDVEKLNSLSFTDPD